MIRFKGDGRQQYRPHTCLLSAEDDFGVEQGAGYAGGYSQEVALAGENFDLTGAGGVGEVDGASGADAGGGQLVGGDAGELRE